MALEPGTPRLIVSDDIALENTGGGALARRLGVENTITLAASCLASVSDRGQETCERHSILPQKSLVTPHYINQP